MPLAREQVDELAGHVAAAQRLGGLGDVAHVVGHARQVEVGIDHELDEAQVARDGLLRGDEHEGLLLERGAVLVHLARLGLDGLGLVLVALGQGVEGVVERQVDVGVDVDELLAHLGELAVEGLSHGKLLRWVVAGLDVLRQTPKSLWHLGGGYRKGRLSRSGR